MGINLENRSSLPRPPLTIHAVAVPTRERRGEASEAAFLARATDLGFRVCIPLGRQRTLRLRSRPRPWIPPNTNQVRHPLCRNPLPRPLPVSARPSTPPKKSISSSPTLSPKISGTSSPSMSSASAKASAYLRSRRPSRAMFERYREAWCLLDCQPNARDDIPTLCRCKRPAPPLRRLPQSLNSNCCPSGRALWVPHVSPLLQGVGADTAPMDVGGSGKYATPLKQ